MKREPLIVRPPTTLMLLYRGIWDGLTKPQRGLLEEAQTYTNGKCGSDGVGVKGGRLASANRLVRLGLIEYIGHGMSLTENDDQERACYAITDKGRSVLKVVTDMRSATR